MHENSRTSLGVVHQSLETKGEKRNFEYSRFNTDYMPIDTLWRRWAFVCSDGFQNSFFLRRKATNLHIPFFPGFPDLRMLFRLKFSGLSLTGNKSWTRRCRNWTILSFLTFSRQTIEIQRLWNTSARMVQITRQVIT